MMAGFITMSYTSSRGSAICLNLARKKLLNLLLSSLSVRISLLTMKLHFILSFVKSRNSVTLNTKVSTAFTAIFVSLILTNANDSLLNILTLLYRLYLLSLLLEKDHYLLLFKLVGGKKRVTPFFCTLNATGCSTYVSRRDHLLEKKIEIQSTLLILLGRLTILLSSPFTKTL